MEEVLGRSGVQKGIIANRLAEFLGRRNTTGVR